MSVRIVVKPWDQSVAGISAEELAFLKEVSSAEIIRKYLYDPGEGVVRILAELIFHGANDKAREVDANPLIHEKWAHMRGQTGRIAFALMVLDQFFKS